MKRNIAIVAGGDTSEAGVSMESAKGIYSFIDRDVYDTYIVKIHHGEWKVIIDGQEAADIDKNDFSFTLGGQKVKLDFAYITVHGTPGEDGHLQGYFEMMGIPYSNCGVLASAMTYNKFVCNHYLATYGIKIADSLCIRRGQTPPASEIISRIGLPCFVKPNLGGSSFGVSKVKEAGQLDEAIRKAFGEADEVMVEALMSGTEVTCGCYGSGGKITVLPVTEVVTKNEFFDYNAKYNGQVEEITPARISDDLTRRIGQVTTAVYEILGCKGIIRVDYIITDGDKINLLEVNTTPGMTKTSFIPQQIRAAGLDIKAVMTKIIEDNIQR